MIALADLAESLGGDVRLTRQQNFVLTNVAADRLDEVTAKLAEIGLPLDAGTLRGDAVACTGEPHCNFSVTETKSRMDGLVQLLEERFGKDADGLRLNLDGCPHACAHHWVGEIGFQGTTVRDEDGKRRQAYDIYLRGSLDRPAAIGAPGVQARADRGARRGGRRPRRRLGRAARRGRDLPRVRRPHDRRRPRAARRTRSRTGQAEEGGSGMSVDVLDDLEAGELAVEFEGEEPEVVIEWAIERFSPSLSISTAFQTDGAVLLHMAYEIDPNIRMFSVDTGRLPSETFELIERMYERYPKLQLDLLSPTAAPVNAMVKKHGPNLFYKSVENRLLCCQVRKVLPLQQHLAGLDAWITGLRRDQWATRSDIRKVEIDHDHGAIVKFNPLAEWSEEDVWDYVKEHDLPYNSLYDKGYTSIGCAPCTRPTQKGEDLRAGRWWWESGAPKECGIHCAIETGGLEHELRALIGDDSD